MKTTAQIQQVDPTVLTVHPAAKRLPEWGKEDPRFIALLEDVRERGIQQAILVDPQNRILDGRELWKAAKRLQLREVPVQVKDENEAISAILFSLVHRKHYTKGALAYVAFPLLEPALEEIRNRQLANLKCGKTPINSRASTQWTLGAKRVEDLAEALGFSRPTLYQAKELHSLLGKSDAAIREWEAENPNAPTDHPERPFDLRAEFEPKILNGDIGLGAAIAGIGGLTSTKGQERNNYGQLELFTEGLETVEKRFRYWDQFDDRTKNQLVPAVRGFVKRMPADLRKEFAKALKEASQVE